MKRNERLNEAWPIVSVWRHEILLPNPPILIADFVQVAAVAGVALNQHEITHEVMLASHHQPVLRRGSQAVYVFSLSSDPTTVLKVGKVGPNSNARFQSQHYNPDSAGSNLARSLVERRDTWQLLDIEDLARESVGEWIRTHTDRDHFFISSDREMVLLALLEVFLQCRLRPLFEG